MNLSIIIPCKNEEENVKGLYESISKVLNKVKYEIIYIDDGSTDNTLKNLRKLHQDDVLHVKYISFSRNFKKEAAMYAGLTHATGKYTCILDGDLQQNPKYLLDMMEILDNEEDIDEVAMVMKDRKVDSGFMKFCKKCFYGLMNKLSDVHFEDAASDFRMFRTNVREAIISLTEKNRFTKGIFSWVGFNVKYVPYEVEPRTSGKSSFNFKNSVAYAFDGIFAFSAKPLRFALKLGVLSLVAFFIYLIVLLVQLIGFDLEWSAVYALILLVLLMGGLLFITIGVLGEYIARITTEVKERPVYIVKEKVGFKEQSIL